MHGEYNIVVNCNSVRIEHTSKFSRNSVQSATGTLLFISKTMFLYAAPSIDMDRTIQLLFNIFSPSSRQITSSMHFWLSDLDVTAVVRPLRQAFFVFVRLNCFVILSLWFVCCVYIWGYFPFLFASFRSPVCRQYPPFVAAKCIIFVSFNLSRLFHSLCGFVRVDDIHTHTQKRTHSLTKWENWFLRCARSIW